MFRERKNVEVPAVSVLIFQELGLAKKRQGELGFSLPVLPSHDLSTFDGVMEDLV